MPQPLAAVSADPHRCLRALLLPRVIEEKMLRLIRQGRISKWFSGYGQEAVAVGCALALGERDTILPMHRNLGVWTTRGVPLDRLFCQLMGRAGGYTEGRDRTFHFGLPERGIVGMISHLAAMLPVACGIGLAHRLDDEPAVALAFCGEGATREGDFHEALNLASVWRLPVVFVVENNGYGLSTPTREAVAPDRIADAALGYAMPGKSVDGNDLNAVLTSVAGARALALSGGGPTLLEMRTFRIRGHEEASGVKYVPEDLLETWAERDPVDQFVRWAAGRGITADEVEALRANLAREVDTAAEYALSQPEAVSTADAELADVFAPTPPAPLPTREEGDAPATPDVRFIDAVSSALRHAMDHDPDVVLMGQDIAEYGGVFKVTEGFLARYGAERVRNTPIIESGAVGCALGLALLGKKPVLEMQYADFISCGVNQIANNLGTTRYRWGAREGRTTGVVIRAPFGGGIGAGPFHSQSMEAWFAHAPGLQVVVPATPHDAKGLLLAALHSPNPTLFFEHKKLYRSLRGPVPDEAYVVPLGYARVAREGDDATVVGWGVSTGWALEAADRFAAEGVSLEVVDLRTLVPWDRETVVDSVRKTSRLVVVHEAWRTGGFGAEVTAEIAEHAFAHLDAPPARVGARDMPIPFARQIEDEVFSAHARLDDAIRRTLSF
jgi:2-oxoisovalerate dehydrogenase E1 component